MPSKQKIITYLFLLTITVAMTAPLGFLYAADPPSAPSYAQLAPLPTPPSGVVTQAGLAGYLQTLFWIAIVLAGVLAVLMITKGGVLYMTSEAFNTKAAAKTQITMAIVGFLLAVSSVLILTTINPDLLKFNLLVRTLVFTVPEIPSGSISGCTGLVAPPVTGCVWFDVTVTNPTNASARCEEAVDTTNNWITGDDSYCAGDKKTYYDKCCQYIPPKNGCSGRGQKSGKTACQWSVKASVGDNCTEAEGMASGFAKTGNENCSGTPPIKESLFQTSSDCCAK